MSDDCANSTCQRRIAHLEREAAVTMTDLGNAEMALRKERREKVSLLVKLRRALGEDEMNEMVRMVVGHFNSRHGRHLKDPKPFSKNDELIRKALRCGDTPEESMALCFDAIDGLAVKPYVVEHNGKARRETSGAERQRHDELKHCLKDEDTIKRFARYAQEAKGDGQRIPDRVPLVPKNLYEDAIEEAATWRQKAEDRGVALELCGDMLAAADALLERALAENAELREAVPA